MENGTVGGGDRCLKFVCWGVCLLIDAVKSVEVYSHLTLVFVSPAYVASHLVLIVHGVKTMPIDLSLAKMYQRLNRTGGFLYPYHGLYFS